MNQSIKSLKKIKEMAESGLSKVTPFATLGFLIISMVISHYFHHTYMAALLGCSLTLAAYLLFLKDNFSIARLLMVYRRDIARLPLMVTACVNGLIALGFLMTFAVSLTRLTIPERFPTLYRTEVDAQLQPNQVYVTYATGCDGCELNYTAMMKAVAAYNETHWAHAQVVDLKQDTPLAKALNDKVDHYGSVIKVDDQQTVHESAYTLSNAQGEPRSNTVSDIYARIVKVGDR